MKRFLFLLAALLLFPMVSFASDVVGYTSVTITATTVPTVTTEYPLWTFIQGTDGASSKQIIFETTRSMKLQLMVTDTAANSINGAANYIEIPANTTYTSEIVSTGKGVYVRLTGTVAPAITVQCQVIKPIAINLRDFQ